MFWVMPSVDSADHATRINVSVNGLTNGPFWCAAESMSASPSSVAYQNSGASGRELFTHSMFCIRAPRVEPPVGARPLARRDAKKRHAYGILGAQRSM